MGQTVVDTAKKQIGTNKTVEKVEDVLINKTCDKLDSFRDFCDDLVMKV